MPNHTDFFSETSSIPNFAMFLERALNPHKDARLRVPFYMTSSWRQNLKIKGVSMRLNPSSVSFRQEKRISYRDTQWGKVYFHWTDSSGRNNDILTMEFSGQTGNINIKSSTRGKGFFGASQAMNKAGSWVSSKVTDVTGSVDTDDPGSLRVSGAGLDMSGASKLANFHNLWSLTREPILDPRTGKPIYYYITYASPLFGNTLITFIGHFHRPLDVIDDANNNPFNAQYSFGFTAQGSYPAMDFIYTSILQNLSQAFINDVSG